MAEIKVVKPTLPTGRNHEGVHGAIWAPLDWTDIQIKDEIRKVIRNARQPTAQHIVYTEVQRNQTQRQLAFEVL